MNGSDAYQQGKVSFKSLDSESMAAARAAADAAGLSLEEWLSRTILRNAGKLGIRDPQTARPEGLPGHQNDAAAHQDARESMEAITAHLEQAQRAADVAGVSVAEWLTRAIMRTTTDGDQVANEYGQPDEVEDTSQDSLGLVGVTDPPAGSGADQDPRRTTVQADIPPRDQEAGASEDALTESIEPEDDDAISENRGQVAEDGFVSFEEVEAIPDFYENLSVPDSGAKARYDDNEGEAGAFRLAGDSANMDARDDGDAAQSADGVGDSVRRARHSLGDAEDTAGDGSEDAGADEDDRTVRFLETPTRRLRGRGKSGRRGDKGDASGTREEDPFEKELNLTTPAPSRSGRRPVMGDDETQEERPRRGSFATWFWTTLLIVLGLLAVAIWTLPNLEEFGLDTWLEDDRPGATSVPAERPGQSPAETGTGGEEQASEEQGTPAPAENGQQSATTAPTEISLAETDPARMPRPPEENVDWYRRAAEAGNPVARYLLGTLYIQGKGVERDLQRAAGLFRSAANEGNYAQAQYALGILFERGLGVDRSQLEAVILFQKAADQGHVLALTKVGEAHLHGRGVSRNYTQAQRYFERAAEVGEPNAQYNLGRMYEIGLGLEPDKVTALKWFTLAAEQNHSEAAGRVEAIVPDLTPEERDRAADLVVEHHRRFGGRR